MKQLGTGKRFYRKSLEPMAVAVSEPICHIVYRRSNFTLKNNNIALDKDMANIGEIERISAKETLRSSPGSHLHIF